MRASGKSKDAAPTKARGSVPDRADAQPANGRQIVGHGGRDEQRHAQLAFGSLILSRGLQRREVVVASIPA